MIFFSSPPGEGGTKVYSTVEYHKVRDVDAKKQTLSIDLLLTLRWFDQNIRTNFTDKIQREDGIILRQEQVKKIWTPDIYLWNRSSVKQKEEWASLKTLKLVASNDVIEEISSDTKTLVEMKYEIKTTV